MMLLMVIDIVTAWKQERQEEQRMTFAVMRKGKKHERFNQQTGSFKTAFHDAAGRSYDESNADSERKADGCRTAGKTHDKRAETHARDLISRQALCEYALNQKDKNITANDIMRFPSAQPERQKGEWIDYTEDGYVECPFCHNATNCDGNKDELHFCFSCGADMREDEQG